MTRKDELARHWEVREWLEEEAQSIINEFTRDILLPFALQWGTTSLTPRELSAFLSGFEYGASPRSVALCRAAELATRDRLMRAARLINITPPHTEDERSARQGLFSAITSS